MRDPALEFFLVSGVARVRAFSDDKYFHLLLENRTDLRVAAVRLRRARSEIRENKRGPSRPTASVALVITPAAIVAKNHPTQDRREIDRCGVERKETAQSFRALDPVDMLRRGLLRKMADPVARIANAPAQIPAARLSNLVVGRVYYLRRYAPEAATNDR